MKTFILLLFIHGSIFCSAQQILSFEEFLSIVKKYHPVARQAGLDVQIAKADVLSARAGFDPVFLNDMTRKELGGLLYYNHQVSELKVPTWYGIELVAGVERLTGERTSTPDTKGNSSYVGFSIPVGKGLLMDNRRAALQQARLMQQLSVQEQRSVLNNLLFDAATAYWNWWQYYQVQLMFRQAVNKAEERLRFVRTAYQLGDRPAIDTVEALTQLQSIRQRENEIGIELFNAAAELSVFMWKEDGSMYELPASVMPDVNNLAVQMPQPELLAQQVAAHPELQQYNYKLDALRIERRLKFQSLLPSVYLKYNQLQASHEMDKLFSTPWLENNYRYGVSIALPLRLSEGRGAYQKAKLKIEQTEWERKNKLASLQMKFSQYYNQWKQVKEQLLLQEHALRSFVALQKGEEVKFANGESSLFLVNARELKTLEVQEKLIMLQGKEQKAAAGTLWISGTLVNF